MIIVSSIFPRHINQEWQSKAVQSWMRFAKSYSLNTAMEIDQLSIYKEWITFIETDKTMEKLLGKSLIPINEMIDFAIEKDDDLMLINSDIFIAHLPELKSDGITILSRWDYTNTFDDAKMFEFGFDVVYIPKQFLRSFPPTIYGMGSTWWDYSYPYRALLNGILVYWPQGKSILHKLHPQHWSFDDWFYAAQYFKWEFKMDEYLRPEEVNVRILAEIKNRSIK